MKRPAGTKPGPQEPDRVPVLKFGVVFPTEISRRMVDQTMDVSGEHPSFKGLVAEWDGDCLHVTDGAFGGSELVLLPGNIRYLRLAPQR